MPRDLNGFDPRQLGNCILWLRPDPSTVALNSGLITQWNDQSGNNNHAVGLANISYVLNALTGKPMAKSVGVGKLDVANITLGAFTLAMLVSGTAGGSMGYLAVHNSDSGSVDGSYFYGQTGATSFVRRSGSSRTLNVSSDWLASKQLTRLAIQKYGAEHRLFRNGVSMASSGTVDAGSVTATLYLMNSQSSSSAFNNLLGEVVLYNRELSDAEIAQLSGYFHQGWSTYT